MDHDGPLPDYYAILKVSSSATTKLIRDAYKRAALENHPDRVPLESPDRKTRTRTFQLINDAYYTLSDKTRRNAYDLKWKIQQRRTGSSKSSKNNYGFTEDDDADTADYPGAFPQDDGHAGAGPGSGAGAGSGSGSGASWRWNPFSSESRAPGAQSAEDAQFADAFEEMMRDEGLAEDGTSRPTNKFWSLVGSVSGGALGFIMANVPGLVAGAVAGNRLGAIRDDKGMSVYAVFQQLPQDDRSRMLGQLAARVLSHAAGI